MTRKGRAAITPSWGRTMGRIPRVCQRHQLPAWAYASVSWLVEIHSGHMSTTAQAPRNIFESPGDPGLPVQMGNQVRLDFTLYVLTIADIKRHQPRRYGTPGGASLLPASCTTETKRALRRASG